jgi:hypothetical protein
MTYAVEKGSGAMIYIPSFINIGSGIQKLLERGYSDTETDRQHGDLTNLFYFFNIRKAD